MKDILLFKFTTWLMLFLCLWITPTGCTHKDGSFTDTSLIAGTFVKVVSPNKKTAKIVFSSLRKEERLFNLYDKDSQLYRLNKFAGIKPVKVSPELIDILQISIDLYKKTDKAFNPTAANLFVYWKDLIEKNKTISLSESIDKDIQKLLIFNNPESIKIDKNNNTVFITKKGLSLDLGGIAKGYMVDKAVKELKKKGITSALISAGGDIYCLGTVGNRAWHIGLRKPDTKTQILTTLDLENKAVATSGDYEQYTIIEEKRYSHIINPKTGYPVNNSLRSVTVIADTATLADGLATAFFVMGEEKTRDFLSQTKLNLEVIITKEKDNKLTTISLKSQ